MATAKIETKHCMFCGLNGVVEVDDSENQWERWRDGELIQNVWPEVSLSIREQLITGTHPACWDKYMAEPE